MPENGTTMELNPTKTELVWPKFGPETNPQTIFIFFNHKKWRMVADSIEWIFTLFIADSEWDMPGTNLSH